MGAAGDLAGQAGDITPAMADSVPGDNRPRPLLLQADVAGHGGGWSVRLPVRAEFITVTKETVIREDVWVGRARNATTVPVSETVRREELRVDRANSRHP
jgi:uncharacterized protein (TIGR02271 family)